MDRRRAVWPAARRTTRGLAVQPLHEGALRAAQVDPWLLPETIRAAVLGPALAGA